MSINVVIHDHELTTVNVYLDDSTLVTGDRWLAFASKDVVHSEKRFLHYKSYSPVLILHPGPTV